jgi:hypothetical protein
MRHGHGSYLDPPLERRRDKREHKAGNDEICSFAEQRIAGVRRKASLAGGAPPIG